ncbi:MAG: glycosyl transferase family 4 [Nanoarchaeota archaeon]|nr:glycosyl transferase family 4 [Nanoarchaeota archaeon]
MKFLFLLIILTSFLSTYLILPYWIKNAHKNKLISKDMHKIKGKKVAEFGGLTVIVGVSIGILLYIAVNTFYFNNSDKLIYIFALLSVLLISSIIGFVDDLLGWKKGLSRKIRILIVLFSAIPLMVISAGTSIMNLPFLGAINFGILYPLLIIPLGILGATVTYNTLAGYNGLEASQGIIILSALAIVTFLTGNSWLSLIILFMIAPLIAFYIFNKYPAKIFPGDILTYSVGALIASIAILGNIEKIAVFFFIPYIIEAVLKTRGKWIKESFAKVNKDGSLEMPYKKIYGLEHLAIYILKKYKSSKKVYEKEVVYLINIFQISVIILGFLIFF